MPEPINKNRLIFLILSVVSFLSGIITLLPYKDIDDECMLGYKAICAFTPVSTIILLLTGVIFWVVQKRLK
ncbi:MAG: hypothetical protein NTV87_00690 [Ignavibacteriae bacterium]|nr:hypothetical protein [Ignavibacteriota bacterium]